MKYMKASVASIIFLFCCMSAYAQNDTAAVRVASLNYIHAFYYGDTVKMHRSISPNVFKFGFSRQRDSVNYVGKTMSWQQINDFVRRVAAQPNPNVDKLPQKVELLDVQNRTAATKVTAWWGTDYLLLGKNDEGQWKILQVLWQSPPKQ